jgi:hypothetical protein
VLSDDGFTLTLEGALRPPQASSAGAVTDLFADVTEPIILGRSRGNEKIALMEGSGTALAIPFGEVRTSSWSVNAALLGAHVDSRNPKFPEVDLELSHLGDWVRGFGVGHTIEQRADKSYAVSVEAETKVLGSAKVPGARIEVSAWPTWSIGPHRGSVEVRPVFHLTLEKPQTWKDILGKWVGPLRDLVSFATLRPNQITNLGVKVDESARAELLTRFLEPGQAGKAERSLVPSDMLFTLAGLPGGFEPGVRRWLRLHQRYRSVVGLLLGIEYAPFIYDENRFLALAQACEVYQRIAVRREPLSKEQHKRRVRNAVDSIADEDLATWVRSVLTAANYRTLRERMEWLVQQTGELRRAITANQPAEFLTRLVDTRNYLTHLGVKKKTVLEGEARYWSSQALAWLLRFALLTRLGFSKREAAEVLRANQPFLWFSRRLADTVQSL